MEIFDFKEMRDCRKPPIYRVAYLIGKTDHFEITVRRWNSELIFGYMKFIEWLVYFSVLSHVICVFLLLFLTLLMSTLLYVNIIPSFIQV